MAAGSIPYTHCSYNVSRGKTRSFSCDAIANGPARPGFGAFLPPGDGKMMVGMEKGIGLSVDGKD